MESIAQNCEDIKKIGLQMTGLFTVLSVGDMTEDKLKMLKSLNEDLARLTSNIVNEAGIVNKNLEECRVEAKCLRKKLQSTCSNLYQSEATNKKLNRELVEVKASFGEIFSEDCFSTIAPSTMKDNLASAEETNVSESVTVKHIQDSDN